MMKKTNTFICWALILGMLIACTSNEQETPNVLDQMCGKLCWSNIVVGTTSREELLHIVRSLASADQSSLSEINQDGLFEERIYFSYYNNPNDKATIVKVSAYLKDQKVVALDLPGNLGVNFQEVVSEFGEPELVSTIWSHGSQVEIIFISSSQGIEFSSSAKSEKTSISPETEIMALELFDPNLYPKLLEANWLIPGYKEFILYPWVGYGKIEELYWPPR